MRNGNGGWELTNFDGEFVYMLENGEPIPQRNVLAKAIYVVRGSPIECPSLVFVRLPSDNAPVYHFVKLVSNIAFHVNPNASCILSSRNNAAPSNSKWMCASQLCK